MDIHMGSLQYKSTGAYMLESFAELIQTLPPCESRDRYEQVAGAGEIFVVRPPYIDRVLWVVADRHVAQNVVDGLGVPRHEVWTLDELRDLIESTPALRLADAAAALAGCPPM
jgi:hypothetical protein